MTLEAGAGCLLVGRDQERQVAAAGFRHAHGVLISGPPGSGKTAMAQAVIADRPGGQVPGGQVSGGQVSGGQVEVRWLLAAGAGPSIPFAAFAPLVSGLAVGSATFDLLQRIRGAVLEQAGARRLVLAVDDADRLDGASATLVFQLVTSGDADLVATVAAGQPVPEPLRALWKDGVVRRIDLGPLGRTACTELAGRWLEGHIGGELADALWAGSGGNPLYLRELIWSGRHTERIVCTQGVWRLEGSLVMGPRLTELAMERLGRLQRAERSTFEIVAFAEPVPMAVLSRLAPASYVSWLQRHGMITVDATEEVRVANPVHAEVVRGLLPAPRLQELRLDVAGAFEAAGRLGSDLLRVMRWRLDAGRADDPEVLLEAAQRAADHRDWALTARLARAAVDADKGSAAARLLADALHRQGRHEEALAALGEWRGDTDSEIAGLAVLRARILCWGLGRMDEAEEALAVAEATVADASERGLVAATRAGTLTFRGRPAAAVAYLRPLLDTEQLSAQAIVAGRTALSLALAWSGRPEEAVDVLDTCPASTLESGDEGPNSVRWAVLARLSAYRMAGRVADMEALAWREYARAVEARNREAQGVTAGTLGWVALARGELPRAMAYFRESAAALPRADIASVRRHSLAGLAEALALAGDADGAAEALAEAAEPGGSAGSPVTWLTVRVAVSQAWLAAARGEISGAIGQFVGAAALARSIGQVNEEIMALHGAARLGETGVADRLAELATWVQGPLVQISAAFAAALAAGDGDALDRVADRWEELTFWLHAAEAAAHASRAHTAAAAPRRAVASAARARAILDRCDGSRLLGVGITLSGPNLTRRELEVAGLAVKRLSSPAIAERLCLSVRTVDTHLARVYCKLGIGGRHQLAAALDGP